MMHGQKNVKSWVGSLEGLKMTLSSRNM